VILIAMMNVIILIVDMMVVIVPLHLAQWNVLFLFGVMEFAKLNVTIRVVILVIMIVYPPLMIPPLMTNLMMMIIKQVVLEMWF
jgi:hypothetical protein